VVDLGRVKLTGLVAWWFWLVAHLFFLIGFRNRLVVLVDWAWSYWTYQRNARIITGGEARALDIRAESLAAAAFHTPRLRCRE
jgi:NADH dehydrogenase